MRIVYFRLFSLKNYKGESKDEEAYEEKIIKLLAEILMEIQD